MRALLEAESGDTKSAAVHLRELAEDDSICAAERYIIWGHLEQLYAYMLDYDEAYLCARTRSDLLGYLRKKRQVNFIYSIIDRDNRYLSILIYLIR